MIIMTCKKCLMISKTFLNLNAKDFSDGWVCDDCDKAARAEKPKVKLEEPKLPPQENTAGRLKDLSKLKVDELAKEEPKEEPQPEDLETKELEKELLAPLKPEESPQPKKKRGRKPGAKSKKKNGTEAI
jgi:hypothetical protein